GDGAGLRAPETALGRVGALVCWEHWMPLARQALHDAGEAIHVAAWPTVREMHQVASRHYAFEGRCFVLAAGSLLRVRDLPPGLETLPELAPDDLLLRGGSAIYGPDGAALAGPCFGEETILHAQLDLRQIAQESMTLDVSGHYARPDVFTLSVNRRRPGEAD
ncbi:MAG: nitrilase, partial [Anaerolineaceae bacterium]|nr:nitrilase [Anaerolineaceae bacterium]